MIRVIETLDNNKESIDNIIEEWLNTTLAGLDDNITYDNVDTTDPTYITFSYYYETDNDKIYLGEWDINYEDMINISDNEVINILNNISAEVDAVASTVIDE